MAENSKNDRKRRRWIILISAVVLLGGGIIGIGAVLRPNNQIDPSKIATVEKGDLAKSVVATGKIEPLAKVEVKSKASGIVKKIYVDYGEKVKTGHVLVELDKAPLQAAVEGD